jgi:Protein of unknown function (DUF5672)
MHKLNLADVTLVSVDTVRPDRTFKALVVCERYADFGDKILITKGTGSFTTASGIRVVPTDEINSYSAYNYFIMKRLASFVRTSFVLVVQYDGFILNPAAWTDAFLNYDYIGAPWWCDHYVGNGGFSLRSKRLLDCLQGDDQITEFNPEDHHICRTYGPRLTNAGIRFAPEALASQFSIEGFHATDPIGRDRVWTGQFGFHHFCATDIRLWDDISWFVDLRVTLSNDPNYVAA